MKTLLGTFFGVCALLAGSLSPAFARTFTSADGKTVEGEIVSANATTLTIERPADKRRFSLTVAKLSPDDQKYVEQWRKENPQFKFTITATKEKDPKGSKGDAKRKSTEFRWKLVVKNDTSEPLKDLKLLYTQVVAVTDKTKQDRKTVPSKMKSGLANIGSLGPNASTTLTTTFIQVQEVNSRTEKDNIVTIERWEEELAGINVEIYWGEVLATKWSHGPYAKYGVEKPREKKPEEEQGQAAGNQPNPNADQEGGGEPRKEEMKKDETAKDPAGQPPAK